VGKEWEEKYYFFIKGTFYFVEVFHIKFFWGQKTVNRNIVRGSREAMRCAAAIGMAVNQCHLVKYKIFCFFKRTICFSEVSSQGRFRSDTAHSGTKCA